MSSKKDNNGVNINLTKEEESNIQKKYFHRHTVDVKKEAREARENRLTTDESDKDPISSDDLNYINPLVGESANVDYELDQLASANIQKIIQDYQRAFASFNKFDKFNIYRYFYKTNPLLGRSIDLHVDLPLSKLRLVPPKNTASSLVKDYVHYYYQSLFSKIDLFAFLREFILHYRIYGEAYALVEDGYGLDKNNRELNSENEIDEIYNKKPTALSKEDEIFLKDVDAKYEKDNKSIPLSDRLQYLKTIFPLFNESYKGPEKLSVIDFYKVDEYMLNSSSSYRALTIRMDALLKERINDLDNATLNKYKITKSYRDLITKALENEEGEITLDNNPYNTSSNTSYIFELGDMTKPVSLIHRVIDQAFEYECLKSAIRTRIQLVGKTGRIITAEGIGEDQLAALQDDIVYMSENPDSEVIVNYNVSIQEFNTNVKEDLDKLIGDYDKIKEEMSIGLGIPQSLLGGESQFSGETIKLEIMNNEYLNFKNLLISKIEEYILKPIAIRKGFFVTNEWGDVELIYPSLSFSRTSLRSESQYDILFNLAEKQKIPVDIIYDLLNIDSESAQKNIKKDLFTSKSPYFGDMIQSVYNSMGSKLGENPDVIRKIMESAGVEVKEKDLQQDDKSSDFDVEEKLGDIKYANKKT